MPPGRTPPPTRRRDAEENRARIIAAAREVFAGAGFSAPLDAIARRAGVGRATLYRNFPDRFSLAAAIVDDNLEALEALAARHHGRPDALLRLLAAIVDQQAEEHALIPSLLAAAAAPELRAQVLRVRRLLRDPLRQARAAGAVRPDLRLADLLDALAMISAVVSAVVASDSQVSQRRRRARRGLELLLHGLVPDRSPAGSRRR